MHPGSLLTHYVYISELGDGWAPTTLENYEEYAFLDVVIKHLDIDTVFIGGSLDESRRHPEYASIYIFRWGYYSPSNQYGKVLHVQS